MITRTCIALALVIGACAPAPASVRTPTPVPTPPPPTAIHWTRTAAEQRVIFLQTYRAATEQVRVLARNRTAGAWAVIMDADETVIDNSEYQRRIAARGERYDTATWHAWAREIAADSLPGAAAFMRTVHELSGRVVIVTGRLDVICDVTRENLRRLQLGADAVLCQRPEERGKEERFRAVAAGTTGAGLPAMEVVMFIGDNIQDFPGGVQQWRTAGAATLEPFGRSWFLLPNPMYGSWERNPPR
jgi:5'-nucleotidase (lipoprotein e(P4) family)